MTNSSQINLQSSASSSSPHSILYLQEERQAKKAELENHCPFKTGIVSQENIGELQNFYNQTLTAVDKLRYPQPFPSLERPESVWAKNEVDHTAERLIASPNKISEPLPRELKDVMGVKVLSDGKNGDTKKVEVTIRLKLMPGVQLDKVKKDVDEWATGAGSIWSNKEQKIKTNVIIMVVEELKDKNGKEFNKEIYRSGCVSSQQEPEWVPVELHKGDYNTASKSTTGFRWYTGGTKEICAHEIGHWLLKTRDNESLDKVNPDHNGIMGDVTLPLTDANWKTYQKYIKNNSYNSQE